MALIGIETVTKDSHIISERMERRSNSKHITSPGWPITNKLVTTSNVSTQSTRTGKSMASTETEIAAKEGRIVLETMGE